MVDGESARNARRLEQEGQTDAAVSAWIQAGSLHDAVRVLVDARRFADAGTLVLRALRATPDDVGSLRGMQRNFAHRAATYFAYAGDHATAIKLFEGLGDRVAAETVRMRQRSTPPTRPTTPLPLSSSPPESTRPSPRPAPSTPPEPAATHASPRPPSPPPPPFPTAQPSLARSAPPRSPPAEARPQAGPPVSAPPRSSPPKSAPPKSAPPRSSPPRSSPPKSGPPKSEPPRGQAGRAPVTRAVAAALEAHGDLGAAQHAYVELKLFADAARVSRRRGNHVEAARLFAECGRMYDAAGCYLEAGATAEALSCLVRVPRDDEHYRAACIEAVKLAHELGSLDFDLDRFVSRFVRSGPLDAREISTFYALGRLYEKHDFAASAKEVYHRIGEVEPDHLDVRDRLADLQEDERSSNMQFAKILREDEAFRQADARLGVQRAESLPDLPSLEELDHIPRAGQRTAPKLAATPLPLLENVRQTPTKRVESPEPLPTPGSQPLPERDTDPAMRHDLAPLAKGAIIGARYRVARELGRGGMATVYEAQDMELDAQIALKIFSANVNDDVLLRRFKRELMLARDLTHENIVRVHDIGTHQGRRFITMELLDGEDLREQMDGPMDVSTAVMYLTQACAGLHAAHMRGVVHRDVKPENFFVTRANIIKVMDFGIAKKLNEERDGRYITQEGYTAGTPAYMAPEQIRSFGTVTHQCDVYSLGIIAFEMLTGELPFYHEEPMPLMMMHLHDKPPYPRLIRPEVPEPLQQVILHALAKDPDGRIKTCAELASRLEEALLSSQ
jgi:serine/threonine-protein kinase